jgi:hypothetical protein
MKRAIILLIISLFFAVHSFSQKLQVFGGEKHDVYLGCLNCSNLETESIWNIQGNYGNNQYSKSIWNDIGIYGNSTSTYSPWNINASYPPVLKDNNGEFYGYLSINEVNGYRADFKLAKTLYEAHELIKQDVDGWYYKIFNRSIVGSN